MTREEAIELLCAYGVPQDEKRFQEAIDMAIEALHREEAEEKGYCHRIRPRGERREPLPQYEEWQDEFNKMCESARPSGADVRGEEE